MLNLKLVIAAAAFALFAVSANAQDVKRGKMISQADHADTNALTPFSREQTERFFQ